MRILHFSALAILVGLSGCGDDGTADDAGRTDASMDTGVLDTGTLDTGGGDTGGGDTGGGDTGGGCMAQQDAVRAFIASNKTCVVDDDCVQVSADCFDAQEDCCVVYMADGYDTTMWDALTGALGTCAAGTSTCGCCAAIPADPACIAGACGRSTR